MRPADVEVGRLVVYTFEEPFMPWLLRSRQHPEQHAAQVRAVEALAALCRILLFLLFVYGLSV